MDIFPYILFRVGGITFEYLETLNISKDNTYKECYERKQNLKNEISGLLYDAISKIKDSEKQNTLLKLKRDLFNERNLNNLDLSGLTKDIEEIVIEKIREYLNLVKEFDMCSNELIRKYESELPILREKLKILSQEKCIQNGLVFSSQSLYKNIGEYKNHNSDYTKNVKKTEVSIIKYLTRIAAKTSPFSSFNNLALGKIVDNESDDKFITNESNEKKIKSYIRLNNSIFAYIRNCLFKLNELYSHFYIIANPTITIQGNQFNYLINFNNVESFQKIEINPIIEYFLSLINENERLVYRDFLDKIVKDEILDATKEEVDEYVYKLIELGFFEFDINISGLDTGWVNKLIKYLNNLPCESESKNIIVDTLKYLDDMILDFERADVVERLELSGKAYKKFLEMKEHLDDLLKPPNVENKNEKEAIVESEKKIKTEKRNEDNEQKINIENNEGDIEKEEDKQVLKNILYFSYDLKPEIIFYEDTIIHEVYNINNNLIINIFKDIQKLMNCFQLFDSIKNEQDTMVKFFRDKYKDDEILSLLTFYEEYINFKKEKIINREKEKKEKKEKEANKSPNNETEEKIQNEETVYTDKEIDAVLETKNRMELQKKWFDKIKEIITNENYSANEDIKITHDMLTKALSLAGLEYKEISNTSLGFFVQFYNNENQKDENRIKAVLNSSFPGFGKMTSRFLHLFSDEFTEATRIWNEKFCGNNIFAENIDSGIMNFNLHPALMPNEISIPGGNFVLNADRRIPVSRLQIAYNKEDNKLQLIEGSTNKKVYAFDLGFQGYGGRSELFKFLGSFTLSKQLFINAFIKSILKLNKPEAKSFNGIVDKVTYHPRIIYNEKIILSRKEWIIPKSLLPFKTQNERESEYFAKVHKWLLELEIPDEVYIKINTQAEIKDEKNKPKKVLSKDDYKPQYINFNNPFLVRLFEKSLDKIPDILNLSEILPNPGQMLKLNNQKYVTESVLQTYFY